MVVCTGDARQILPVIKDNNRTATVQAFIPGSYLWQWVQLLQLNENMRILPCCKASLTSFSLADFPRHFLGKQSPRRTPWTSSFLIVCFPLQKQENRS